MKALSDATICTIMSKTKHRKLKAAHEWVRRFPQGSNLPEKFSRYDAIAAQIIAANELKQVTPMELLKRLVEHPPWERNSMCGGYASPDQVCHYCECANYDNHKDDCIYKLAMELVDE